VQAVLKRKTEEAEAAKKRLRELMEVQARARWGGGDVRFMAGPGKKQVRKETGSRVVSS
jgi:hypothetical protein